jgi:hypothetical protein
VSRFQFPVRVVVHARQIDGFGAVALGVTMVVVGREVRVASSFACAVFLFDVFRTAAVIARSLRGNAVVFAVGHGEEWKMGYGGVHVETSMRAALRTGVERGVAVVDSLRYVYRPDETRALDEQQAERERSQGRQTSFHPDTPSGSKKYDKISTYRTNTKIFPASPSVSPAHIARPQQKTQTLRKSKFPQNRDAKAA